MKTKLHTRNTYSANRTLESIIWVTAIILLFILFSYTNTFANPTTLERESYINDIPFNTEMRVNLVASTFNLNEETYIDDIPFNTTELYNDIIAEQEPAEFDFDEEEYIDDITIDTKCISTHCLYQRAISVEFNLDEEQFINDIEL